MERISKCSGCGFLTDRRKRSNMRGEYYCKHPALGTEMYIGTGNRYKDYPDRRSLPKFCPIANGHGNTEKELTKEPVQMTVFDLLKGEK